MPDLQWDESQVEPVLEWNSKAPPHHVETEPLRGLDLATLRAMFGVGPDDLEDPPMFNGYAVEPRHVGRLQKAVTHEIDLDRYDYFVAAFQRGS